jgi:thiazole synthase
MDTVNEKAIGSEHAPPNGTPHREGGAPATPSAVQRPLSADPWSLAELQLRSRVLLGSSGYPDLQTLLDSVDAAGAEVVTVAIRRVDLAPEQGGESLLGALRGRGVHLLPNTAGCYTAREAVLTAQLAREALGTDLVKLEVIGDDETLYPDAVQLLRAAEELIGDGFRVLAYCGDDPVTARKLADLGCDAVMPLAAPIGSGMGLLNPYALRIIREMIPDVPLIVDAGLGTASDAARAMELGYDGILLNTAVAGAKHPVEMAGAFRLAVEAGRRARAAGRIPRRRYARPSSPAAGRIGSGRERGQP